MDAFSIPVTPVLGISSAALALSLLPRRTGLGAAALVAAAVLAAAFTISDPGIPLFVGVVVIGVAMVEPAKLRERGSARALLVQLVVMSAGMAAYLFSRTLVNAQFLESWEHAQGVIDFEKGLGLWVEPQLQGFFAGPMWSESFFNAVYLHGYFGLVVAALLWLWFTDDRAFRLLRNTLGVSALLALILMTVMPVAPPRLVPGLGLEDTLASAGLPRTGTNPFAAVPSLHVGWVVIAAVIVARSLANRWAAATAALASGLMTLTVMVTGNHYWFDAFIGTAICVIAAMFLGSDASKAERPLPQRTSRPVNSPL